MSLNPFTLLDQILADYASPKIRRTIHLIFLLAAAILTIYLGVGGEWKEFVIALAATIYTAANKANTPPVDEPDEPIAFYDGDVSGNQPLF